jgi:hypothetical protein
MDKIVSLQLSRPPGDDDGDVVFLTEGLRVGKGPNNLHYSPYMPFTAPYAPAAINLGYVGYDGVQQGLAARDTILAAVSINKKT